MASMLTHTYNHLQASPLVNAAVLAKDQEPPLGQKYLVTDLEHELAVTNPFLNSVRDAYEEEQREQIRKKWERDVIMRQQKKDAMIAEAARVKREIESIQQERTQQRRLMHQEYVTLARRHATLKTQYDDMQEKLLQMRRGVGDIGAKEQDMINPEGPAESTACMEGDTLTEGGAVTSVANDDHHSAARENRPLSSSSVSSSSSNTAESEVCMKATDLSPQKGQKNLEHQDASPRQATHDVASVAPATGRGNRSPLAAAAHSPQRSSRSPIKEQDGSPTKKRAVRKQSVPRAGSARKARNTARPEERIVLPKRAKDAVRVWFKAHVEKPWPTEDDKAKILEQHPDITYKQLQMLFTNERRRHWYAYYKEQYPDAIDADLPDEIMRSHPDVKREKRAKQGRPRRA